MGLPDRRINALEKKRLVLNDQLATAKQPLRSFDEMYRTALHLLANPLKIWHSGRLEDKRAVLKLVFSESLIYTRNGGYRTPKSSLPFSVVGGE